MSSKLKIYSEQEQGVGSFDGGNFIEQRPVSFPGERTAVSRVGSLFYWAWGKSPKGNSLIGMHPHKGFEIMSYIIQGMGEHKDTLGTLSQVGAGGAQVMQTGSGISHEERIVEPDTEMFQIWFEPELRKAFLKPPTYNAYENADFPVHEEHHVTVKTIIGEGSPIQLDTDTASYDITIDVHGSYEYKLGAGRMLAVLAIRGAGSVENNGDAHPLNHKDFLVVETDQEEIFTFQSAAAEALRIYAIEVPTKVEYTLYSK